MRLTIEISDGMFENLKNDRIKNGSIAAHVILDAVKNGTSLNNEVLDKLKEEVKSKIVKRPWLDFEDRERDRNDAFLEVLDIIDKYKRA